MSDPYIGEVRIFGFDYAPIGWAFCDGQLLPLAQYQALYAVVGTLYGGDGRNNFGVPNLMGRVPVDFGMGSGLTNYNIAQAGGNSTITLNGTQIPYHNHDWKAINYNGSTSNPNGLFTGIHNEPGKGLVYTPDPTLNATLAGQAVGASGNNLPHENKQPYLPFNFCIALEGVFPVRQ